MACCSHRAVRALLISGLSLWSGLATAQAPADGSFPAEATTPATSPAPAIPPPPAAPPAPPPTSTEASPAVAPPPSAPPGPVVEQPRALPPAPEPGYDVSGEPPAPPAPVEGTSAIPPFSVRLDPLNWIIEGRLGLELEVGLAKWLTVETIPIFVTDDSPPLMNYRDYDVRLFQHSDGWGPLAGASLGVNFWLSGKAFKGYVLRTGITNYGFEYESRSEGGDKIDSVTHVERQLFALIGSVNRWGAFTVAGGIGLGYDLNDETRCFTSESLSVDDAVAGDCDELQLATDPVPARGRGSVTSFTYPWEILARFSLGVTID